MYRGAVRAAQDRLKMELNLKCIVHQATLTPVVSVTGGTVYQVLFTQRNKFFRFTKVLTLQGSC